LISIKLIKVFLVHMKNSKELDNGIERKNLVLRDIITTGTYLKIFGH